MLRINQLQTTKQLITRGNCWRRTSRGSIASCYLSQTITCPTAAANARISFRSSTHDRGSHRINRCLVQPASLHAPLNFLRPSSVWGRSSGRVFSKGRQASGLARRFYSSKPPTFDKDGSGKEESLDDDKAGVNRARLAKLVETSVVPTLKRVEDSVIPTLKRVEDSVKPTLKRVSDWYAGDLFTVYAIAILFIFVVTAPTVSRHMKTSEIDFEQVDSDDAIAHSEMLARQILFNLDENGEKESTMPKAADLLQTIMTSEPLKDALIKLINKVMESEEFQSSAKELVRSLWNDLVEDPETTAQVVHLLNYVIQTEEIQHAAQELVVKIVNNKAVFDELVQLLNRIGQDHEVLEATQKLLMESAHRALNDEEILDHSMEFVADVVADDTIQRTTGDAIRHTISHAVRPAISAFLIATGLGFLLFSISALSNARLSDREVQLLEQSLSKIASSIQRGAVQAIPTMLSVTGRLLSRLGRAFSESLRKSGSVLSQLGISTWNASTRWLILFPFIVVHSIGSIFMWTGQSITHGIVAVSAAALSSLSIVRLRPPSIHEITSMIYFPGAALRNVGAIVIKSIQNGIARITTIIFWPFGSSDGPTGTDDGAAGNQKIKVD